MLAVGAGVLRSVGMLAMLLGRDIDAVCEFGRVRGNKTSCLSSAKVAGGMETAEEELLEFATLSMRDGVTGTALPCTGINKV